MLKDFEEADVSNPKQSFKLIGVPLALKQLLKFVAESRGTTLQFPHPVFCAFSCQVETYSQVFHREPQGPATLSHYPTDRPELFSTVDNFIL